MNWFVRLLLVIFALKRLSELIHYSTLLPRIPEIPGQTRAKTIKTLGINISVDLLFVSTVLYVAFTVE